MSIVYLWPLYLGILRILRVILTLMSVRVLAPVCVCTMRVLKT